MQDAEIYSPASQAEWREWLIRNHLSTPSVWLVFYKKKSERHNLTWAAAVDEALCFGWVDGRRKPVLVLPADLQLALKQQDSTFEYYSGLSNSVKKSILQWVTLCKTDKTRQQRITEIVNSAKFNTVPAALKR